MKYLIFLCSLISASTCYSMHNPKTDESNNKDTLFGPVDNASFSKLIDDLEKEEFYIGPHIHEVSCYPHNPPPPPAQFHMPSRAEIKVQNREETQRLRALAHQMIKEEKGLNSHISFGWQSGKTLLSLAASHKCRQSILQLALAHGADPNQPNEDGTTPLQNATTTYCAVNVNYLLSRGATFDFAGKDKDLLSQVCSPITDEIAPKSTRRKVATINALIAAGADPNTTDLHFKKITFAPSILSGLLCHFLVIKKLNKNDSRKQERYSAFLDLRTQMIKTLLEAGLNPFKKDETGKTDWENIVAQKDNYDEFLFNFAQELVQKKKVN